MGWCRSSIYRLRPLLRGATFTAYLLPSFLCRLFRQAAAGRGGVERVRLVPLSTFSNLCQLNSCFMCDIIFILDTSPIPII